MTYEPNIPAASFVVTPIVAPTTVRSSVISGFRFRHSGSRVASL